MQLPLQKTISIQSLSCQKLMPKIILTSTNEVILILQFRFLLDLQTRVKLSSSMCKKIIAKHLSCHLSKAIKI